MPGRPAPSRRGFLRVASVVELGSLAGCSFGLPTEPTAPASPTATEGGSALEEFVERDGAELRLGDGRFQFSGANNTWLSVQFEAGAGTIEELLPDARRLGLNVVRTPAYGAGIEGNFQPEPRGYNEEKFRRLDRVIAAAGRQGIRLVLPLVNGYGKRFRPGMQGGMDQYVEWSSTAETHNDFYTDPGARALYRDYVEYVLTRENTVTGVEYRDDPTIMLWELANEPHLRDHERTNPRWTEDDYEAMGSWFEEMATFVKSLDANHLVSTGSEGFYSDGTFDDGNARTRYLTDHASEAIDLASFHYYPGYDVSPDDWIETHVRDAKDKLGKPAYLGEFGAVELKRRPELFRAVYRAILESDGDGAAFWQLIGHDGRTGELRTPSNPADSSAGTRFVYYPESQDVVPVIREFSEQVTAGDR